MYVVIVFEVLKFIIQILFKMCGMKYELKCALKSNYTIWHNQDKHSSLSIKIVVNSL